MKLQRADAKLEEAVNTVASFADLTPKVVYSSWRSGRLVLHSSWRFTTNTGGGLSDAGNGSNFVT